ncbi:hypothetical protein H6P81_003124 [Aristolochia fimbriata]|uniref:Uncharacterized protein n=1 Tax=Aristolochia fimbriata TaxID=158543 RepID=A0AAV7FCT4_ARIFI|nr:hypothetical protein H6P81_003124 [Aristolochia fimbriata]
MRLFCYKSHQLLHPFPFFVFFLTNAAPTSLAAPLSLTFLHLRSPCRALPLAGRLQRHSSGRCGPRHRLGGFPGLRPRDRSRSRPGFLALSRRWGLPSDPSSSPDDSLYASGVNKMISAVSSADPRSMDDSVSVIEVAAQSGNPHAQSTLAFLYGTESARDLTPAKAFL